MKVLVTDIAIDVAAETERLRRRDCGALVVFEGNVRSPNNGVEISHLEYEAYGEVAKSQLEKIANDAIERFGLTDIAMIHRVGRLEPGRTAFLVVAAAPHRQAAFAGCTTAVDRTKAEAAIWKLEYAADGTILGERHP